MAEMCSENFFMILQANKYISSEYITAISVYFRCVGTWLVVGRKSTS